MFDFYQLLLVSPWPKKQTSSSARSASLNYIFTFFLLSNIIPGIFYSISIAPCYIVVADFMCFTESF